MLPRALPRFHRNSLKFTLLLPYVLLIAALTASIGAVTYWAGARTVSSLSEKLLHEMVERIQQAVVHHVNGSGAVLEAAFPAGMPASERLESDWPRLRERLWAATTLHPGTNQYVYYGNMAGQGAGLLRLDSNTAELRIKHEVNERRRYYHIQGIQGQPRYLRTEHTVFDPRQRPWFQLAQAMPQHTWTAVYIDFNAKDLVVTRARRVLNDQGTLQGVVGTDVSLLALNQFVDSLASNVNGRAMIFEPRGDLIAISGMHNVRQRDDGKMERVTVHNLEDPLIHAVYEHLLPWFRQWGPPQHTQVLHDAQGKPVHLAFRRLTDSAGLDWMAVVAVPRASILADVSLITEQVLLIGALAMVSALLIGWRVFGRVADDVGLLSRAVRRMQRGDIEGKIQVQRKDEVGELAQSFVRMRHALFTDPLTGVANRSALQQILGNMVRQSANPSEPTPEGESVLPPRMPFAVLFIDLNRFKPLNDRWGHDNGDRALTEVAQRLRQQLRSNDCVARLGGDEFVVLIQPTSARANLAAEVQHVQQRLIDAVGLPLTTLQNVPAGEVVTLGAAIGVAFFPEDGEDVESLLRHADQAMYSDKLTAARPR